MYKKHQHILEENMMFFIFLIQNTMTFVIYFERLLAFL